MNDSRVEPLVRLLMEKNDYISTVDLAHELRVSPKTLFRDFPVLSAEVEKHGMRLVRTRGKGIRMEGSPGDAEGLMKTLKPAEDHRSFSVRQRCLLLFVHLLKEPRETKLLSLALALRVSESCASRDLSILERELAPFGAGLSGRSGGGIRLRGGEAALRSAFLAEAFGLLNENLVLGLFGRRAEDLQAGPAAREESAFTAALLGLLFEDNAAARLSSDAVELAEAALGVKFTDIGYLSTLLALRIAALRAANGHALEPDGQTPQPLPRKAEAAFREAFRKAAGAAGGNAEAAAFASFAQSVDVAWKSGSRKRDSEKYTTLALVVIHLFELEYSCSVVCGEELLSFLTLRLEALERRKRHGYGYWFAAVTQGSADEGFRRASGAVAGVLAASLHPQADERDAAAIVSCLVPFIEELKRPEIRVLVVCASGLNSACYLADFIQKNIASVRVVKALGFRDLTQEMVDREKVDVIISTVAADAFKDRTVLVHPDLSALDVEALTSRVQGLLAREGATQRERRAKNGTLPRKEIEALLASFFLLEGLGGFDDILDGVAGRVMQDSPERKEAFMRDLRERERLGSVVLKELGVRLLHCTTRSLNHSVFGVVRAHYFAEDYDLFLVLAAPHDFRQSNKDVLGVVVKALTYDEEFLAALRTGGRDAVMAELLAIFDYAPAERGGKDGR